MIFEGLKTNLASLSSSLTDLDLSANKTWWAGEAGLDNMRLLCSSISECANLKRFNFSDNNAHDQVMAQLLTTMSSSQQLLASLSVVVLDGNSFECPDCHSPLAEFAALSTALTSISIEN